MPVLYHQEFATKAFLLLSSNIFFAGEQDIAKKKTKDIKIYDGEFFYLLDTLDVDLRTVDDGTCC